MLTDTIQMSYQLCKRTFSDASSHVLENLPIFSRFCDEVVRNENILRIKVKELYAIIADAMENHMYFGQDYFTKYEKYVFKCETVLGEERLRVLYALRSMDLKNNGSAEDGEENSIYYSNTFQ